ncbi:hypothetical protein BCR34DRAFT_531809 [Clohesyomyces aquaticus]|uniref:Stress-associated endoplasmic reticulum protein n=1 Tax=Clohesyomyces aquaticus TaxID=1231657 RepID=A0A1Y2A137_9PLEO|nr:hypothetical protein BCR34DRAFT_531809 [Clohesyomyces aquaticus]
MPPAPPQFPIHPPSHPQWRAEVGPCAPPFRPPCITELSPETFPFWFLYYHALTTHTPAIAPSQFHPLRRRTSTRPFAQDQTPRSRPSIHSSPSRNHFGHLSTPFKMAQTPQQRAANAKFARREEAKMGKPVSAVQHKKDQKAPISKGWIILLAFALCGGVIFELVRMFL